MGCHYVDLLNLAVKIDGLTTLVFAAGVGFFVFVSPLRGVLLGLFLEYFAHLHGLTGAMKQECFVTGRPITRMYCIMFLGIASASLLGFCWRCRFSSFIFLAMTGTIGI